MCKRCDIQMYIEKTSFIYTFIILTNFVSFYCIGTHLNFQNSTLYVSDFYQIDSERPRYNGKTKPMKFEGQNGNIWRVYEIEFHICLYVVHASTIWKTLLIFSEVFCKWQANAKERYTRGILEWYKTIFDYTKTHIWYSESKERGFFAAIRRDTIGKSTKKLTLASTEAIEVCQQKR